VSSFALALARPYMGCDTPGGRSLYSMPKLGVTSSGPNSLFLLESLTMLSSEDLMQKLSWNRRDTIHATNSTFNHPSVKAMPECQNNHAIYG